MNEKLLKFDVCCYLYVSFELDEFTNMIRVKNYECGFNKKFDCKRECLEKQIFQEIKEDG